jgi:hypothetical protein
MAHEEEGLVVCSFFPEPFQGLVAYDIAGVALVYFSSLVSVFPWLTFFFEQRVKIETLAREHFVVVEADRFRM